MDYGEINAQHEPGELKRQSARCMDCGTPFCQTHTGCPINNLIPEFNQMVFDEQWKQAYTNLSSTNNFPEFTGRVCPAPCEGSCVAGLVDEAVTIKNMEYNIIDKAWESGGVVPRRRRRSGKTVAVIGSGPAGLAAADELNKEVRPLGHRLRARAEGGRAALLTLRHPQHEARQGHGRAADLAHGGGGRHLPCNVEVGADATSLMDDFDAVVLAIGSTVPNNLPIPGRELDGIVFAMEFLTANQNQTRLFADALRRASSARRRSPPPPLRRPRRRPSTTGLTSKSRATLSTRRTRTSSSSAAATPAPTASPPRSATAAPR